MAPGRSLTPEEQAELLQNFFEPQRELERRAWLAVFDDTRPMPPHLANEAVAVLEQNRSK